MTADDLPLTEEALDELARQPCWDDANQLIAQARAAIRLRAERDELAAKLATAPALTDGPNVWIGYCDLCNGQHCLQMLEATGGEEIRRRHPAAERDAALARVGKLREALRAAVKQHATHDDWCGRYSMMRDQPRSCDCWMEDAQAALAAAEPAK